MKPDTEAEGPVDPDRLTDATRADLAESVDALSRNLERGLLASERVKLREAARALRSTPEARAADEAHARTLASREEGDDG